MSDVVCAKIRQPVQAEMVLIDEIWQACWPGAMTSPCTRALPHYAPRDYQDVSMAFVGGEAVACVAYARKELLIGTTRVHLGGVCEVATKTSHQGQGLCGRLMQEAVRRMAGRGDHVSALFTFSYDFYRRFGWAVGGDYWDLLLYTAEFGQESFALPRYPDAADMRPLSSEDVAGVAALHVRHLDGKRWGVVRPPDYWTWARQELDSHEWWVVDGSEGVEGYCVTATTPRLQLPDEFTFRRSDDVRWPQQIGPVLHVAEIVAETAHARRAITSHLAQRLDQLKALAYPLACRYDLYRSGLLVPSARVRVTPAFMFRVVDALRATMALTDLMPPAVAFSVSIDDPVGLNARPIVFAAQNGELEVAEGPLRKHHLSMSIRAFSQLYAGYRTAAELAALGQMECMSSRAIELADSVFAQREPHIGELDLF